MLGPGTYIFPNGCQQHGEYVIVEDEPDENEKETDDSETDRGVKTRQMKIKWISRGGLHSPVTVIKKETLINWKLFAIWYFKPFSPKHDKWCVAKFS